MENKRLFDKIRFEVGDKVIRKFKGDKPKPEIVCREELVNNLDGFTYSVIFFESNPKDFHIAFEYEPVDKADKKRYYEVWEDFKKTFKNTSKKKVVPKVKKLKLKKKELNNEKS